MAHRNLRWLDVMPWCSWRGKVLEIVARNTLPTPAIQQSYLLHCALEIEFLLVPCICLLLVMRHIAEVFECGIRLAILYWLD